MRNNKLVKLFLKDTITGEDMSYIRLSAKDLNKIIHENFGIKDNIEVSKVSLLNNSLNERVKASTKII